VLTGAVAGDAPSEEMPLAAVLPGEAALAEAVLAGVPCVLAVVHPLAVIAVTAASAQATVARSVVRLIVISLSAV
jgi:hypothetical protein